MTEPTPVRLVESRVRRPPAVCAPDGGCTRAGRRRCRRGGRPSTATPSPSSTRRVAEQIDRIGHVMFGGLTHEPAVRLAERLIGDRPRADGARLPRRLRLGVGRGRAQDGAAVPARPSGDPERTAVADGPRRLPRRHLRLHERVRPGRRHALDVQRACWPAAGLRSTAAGSPVVARSARTLGDDDRFARRCAAVARPHELAGIIVEPLLQGAGGMHVYDAAACACCATSPTSTGWCWSSTRSRPASAAPARFFASEAAGVAPDIMCVGKALTGGYLSLAAVLCTRRGGARRSPPRSPAS